MKANIRILRGCDNNRSCIGCEAKETKKINFITRKNEFTSESTYSNPDVFSKPRRKARFKRNQKL